MTTPPASGDGWGAANPTRPALVVFSHVRSAASHGDGPEHCQPDQEVALTASWIRSAVIFGWLIIATWDEVGTSTTLRKFARVYMKRSAAGGSPVSACDQSPRRDRSPRGSLSRVDEGVRIKRPLSGLQESELIFGQIGGEGRLTVLAQVQVGSGGAVGLRVRDRTLTGRTSLPGNMLISSPCVSPTSGTNAAMSTNALTLLFPAAAFVMTVPPIECATSTTGPLMESNRLPM